MTTAATYHLPYIAIRPARLDSLRETVSDSQLGVAVRLVHFCIVKGYAGRIPASRDWTARQWLLNTGVDTPPVTDVANLWHWEADALVADLYDHEYAEKYLARIARSKDAAHARWNADASGNSMRTHTQTDANAPIIYNNKLNNNTVHLSQNNKERVSMNNAYLSYTDWKAALKPCHPSCSKVARDYFAKDVEDAALEAYHLYPEAPLHADLLKAFFADTKIRERKNGIAFFRPSSQRAFFANLGDIITHAEDWAKETRWKKTPTKKHHHHENTNHTTPQQETPAAAAEDTAAFTSWLSADVDAHTAGSCSQADQGEEPR